MRLFGSFSETAKHRAGLLAIVLLAAGLALAPELTVVKTPPLTPHATLIGNCPDSARQTTVVAIDAHTFVAKTNNDNLSIYDLAANSKHLLPPVSFSKYWRSPQTSEGELFSYGYGNVDGSTTPFPYAVSHDRRRLLWIVTSGVVEVDLSTGFSKQIISYPVPWLNQWKIKWQGGYPGGPTVQSAKPSIARLPDPDLIQSIAYMPGDNSLLLLESANAGVPSHNVGVPSLRIRDKNGNVLKQMKINAMSGQTNLQILGFVNSHLIALKAGSIFFALVDLNGMAIQKTWTQKPPPDCDGIVALSPDGTRLLWQGTVENTSYGWLRHLGRYHYYPSTQVINVSNLDDSDMHEIGREDPAQVADYNSEDTPNFQWLPDSKHAAFIMNGKVWSIAL